MRKKRRQLYDLLEIQQEYMDLLLTIQPGSGAEMLRGETNADPDWLIARTKNLLLKQKTAKSSMQALLQRGETLKAEYLAAYGSDSRIEIQDQAILEPIRGKLRTLDDSITELSKLLSALREAKNRSAQIDLAALLAGIR